MRASTVTKLSLYDFAKIVGIHPLHFAQVAFTPADRPQSLCDQVYFQYPWQDADRIGREDIAEGIAEAEELIERSLGFRLAPSWEVDEWRPTEQPYDPSLVRYGYSNLRGERQLVRATWGHFISGGVKTKTLIAANRPIVYTDLDVDAYEEVATITATVAADQDPCEVALYYPGKSAADEYEIRPINVSISGTTATITLRREQLVVEAQVESLSPEPLVGTDDANFLTLVDVYRRWNDPQTQATLVWEPTGTCGCVSGTCEFCAIAQQAACIVPRADPRLSLLGYAPAEWSADDDTFNSAALALARQPEMVRLYYYAGLRDKSKTCTRDMDNQWKRTVAHYACALLDRAPCDCVQTEWEYWREDLALISGSDSTSNQKGSYQIDPTELRNPFGTRRGMIDAWRRVTRDPRNSALPQVAVP